MKRSTFKIITYKSGEVLDKDESTNLLLRAGFIKKVSSGIFYFTNLGNKLVENINSLIKNELNKFGYFKSFLFPFSRKSFWNKRDILGEAFINEDYVFHPTSEEVIYELLKNDLLYKGCKDAKMYLESVNFRNEKRPNYGLCRTKAFLMHDAYGLFKEKNIALKEFNNAILMYENIFSKLSIKVEKKLSSNECEFLVRSEKMKTCIENDINMTEIAHIFNFNNLFYDNLYAISFGIGISRLIQLFSTFNSNTLSFPIEITPFRNVIIPRNKDYMTKAQKYYQTLDFNDTLLDDMNITLSAKIFDAKLIGAKKIIFVGENLEEENVI